MGVISSVKRERFIEFSILAAKMRFMLFKRYDHKKFCFFHQNHNLDP